MGAREGGLGIFNTKINNKINKSNFVKSKQIQKFTLKFIVFYFFQKLTTLA